jgi:hypothetical protein
VLTYSASPGLASAVVVCVLAAEPSVPELALVLIYSASAEFGSAVVVSTAVATAFDSTADLARVVSAVPAPPADLPLDSAFAVVARTSLVLVVIA